MKYHWSWLHCCNDDKLHILEYFFKNSPRNYINNTDITAPGDGAFYNHASLKNFQQGHNKHVLICNYWDFNQFMSVLHVLAMFSICTPSFIWHYKAATCTIMINYCTSLLHTWFCGLVCNCILKQVRPSHRLAHIWFLKILSAWASVCEWMCLHVCVPPPRLIKTSGMTWCYVDHI